MGCDLKFRARDRRNHVRCVRIRIQRALLGDGASKINPAREQTTPPRQFQVGRRETARARAKRIGFYHSAGSRRNLAAYDPVILSLSKEPYVLVVAARQAKRTNTRARALRSISVWRMHAARG